MRLQNTKPQARAVPARPESEWPGRPGGAAPATERGDEWAALFGKVCGALRESRLPGVRAISLSVALDDGPDDAWGLWQLGKEVARRHKLGSSASLRGDEPHRSL
jgi:hypothetical protein